MGWSLAGVSVLLFVIGGMLYLNNARQGKSSIFPERSKTIAAARSEKESTTEDADDSDAKPTTPTPTTAAAAPAKSVDDLKVSPIVLRRTQGSTLVYAIGSVHNNSDQQRFGVSLELDLLDAGGKKIGTAKDYAKIIEPRKDWRFRALVVAPKTVSVKLAKIREDE
jgi:cytoskeletal protein RodZ